VKAVAKGWSVTNLAISHCPPDRQRRDGWPTLPYRSLQEYF
jgi:hypothetical protein